MPGDVEQSIDGDPEALVRGVPPVAFIALGLGAVVLMGWWLWFRASEEPVLSPAIPTPDSDIPAVSSPVGASAGIQTDELPSLSQAAPVDLGELAFAVDASVDRWIVASGRIPGTTTARTVLIDRTTGLQYDLAGALEAISTGFVVTRTAPTTLEVTELATGEQFRLRSTNKLTATLNLVGGSPHEASVSVRDGPHRRLDLSTGLVTASESYRTGALSSQQLPRSPTMLRGQLVVEPTTGTWHVAGGTSELIAPVELLTWSDQGWTQRRCTADRVCFLEWGGHNGLPPAESLALAPTVSGEIDPLDRSGAARVSASGRFHAIEVDTFGHELAGSRTRRYLVFDAATALSPRRIEITMFQPGTFTFVDETMVLVTGEGWVAIDPTSGIIHQVDDLPALEGAVVVSSP